MSYITVWTDKHGTAIRECGPMSLADVQQMIADEPAAPDKAALPLLKFATFGDKRSPQRNGAGGKALRWDGNVLSVTGLEGDYDGEQMPMATAAERLTAAGVLALLYTSASHELLKPRWRVLCPLSEALSGTPEELKRAHKRWVGVLNGILGGVLKSESFALSQSYFFGPVAEKPAPEVLSVPGLPIDQVPGLPEPVFPSTGTIASATAPEKPKDRSQSADLLRKVAPVVTDDEGEDDAIVEEFKLHPHALRQTDPERAVRRCIEKVRADRVAVLAEMNILHAVVSWKGKTLVLSEKMDPSFKRMTIELSSFGDLKNWYLNQFIGKKTRADWWLRHRKRRQYATVAFVPGGETPGAYNLWHGFGVQPAAGDCSLYLTMIEDVICSGNKPLAQYVIGWMADAVQNPAERPGVVLVFRGPQGVGKGTLARGFGEVFGAHFLHLTHAGHLTGKFNAHLANTLLLFADECFWAGDKQGESVLKGLITEPTVAIEYKGKDVITVPNYVRIVMASNKDWVVPAALDDRRFCVIDVSDKHIKDAAYFAQIRAQMKAGGAAALLDYLLKFDLRTVDLRKIPETAARTEQQLRSMDPAAAFWFARLNNGSQCATESTWAEKVVRGELYDEYAEETRVSGENRRGHETAFGIQLKKMCPGVTASEIERVVFPAQDADTKRGKPESPAVRKRFKAHKFPPLAECRRAFERFAGRPFTWDEITGAVRERRGDEM